MNIRSIFFLVMIVGISNPCAMTLSAMSHGFSIEQKQVIAQYGASCGYHALKNVVYLLRDEDNGLMSKEVVDDLLGANGRWRQWIKQQRVFSNIPTSVRQQVKANFCIKKLISSPKPRYDAIKIDGYTGKEMDEFNNILCEMLRKRFDACFKSIEVSKSISIAVSDIQGTINNLICDTGTTSRDIKEFRKWLKEQELDTAIPSLSIQVNELHRSEIGDDLSAGEIENIIEREKQTGKGLLEDLPISVGLPNNAIQGIKQQFEKNPSYRHGFVLNTGGHWISLVVAKNKALIADSINGDHSSSYAVKTILQKLGINLQRGEEGRVAQQLSTNEPVNSQPNRSLPEHTQVVVPNPNPIVSGTVIPTPLISKQIENTNDSSTKPERAVQTTRIPTAQVTNSTHQNSSFFASFTSRCYRLLAGLNILGETKESGSNHQQRESSHIFPEQSSTESQKGTTFEPMKRFYFWIKRKIFG